MNELSRIQFEPAQEHPDYVSGRVLHQALEIKTPYRKWFPRVCVQNGYEEGQDYMTSVKKDRRADGAPIGCMTDGCCMPGMTARATPEP